MVVIHGPPPYPSGGSPLPLPPQNRASDRVSQAERTAPRLRQAGLAIAVAAVLAGCAAAPPAEGINDPYEPQNRNAHAFNVGLDRVILRPTANAYGTIVPGPVRTGVSNFASNLNQPGTFVNHVLQGEIEKAGQTFFRFAINTTLGIGGIFDPATSIGLPAARTDFGQTLHAWGVPEGAYLEVPVIGPTTERDFTGQVFDVLMNPTSLALKGDEATVATGARVASRFGDRYRYSDFVDSILYVSGDSYAQSRLLYLQNRRFQLGQQDESDAYDPYEDPDIR